MNPDPVSDGTGAWPDPESRWGLGEVALGIVASQVLLLVAQVVVFGLAGWTSVEEVPLWATAVLQIPLWAGWIAALAVAGSKGHGVVREFGFTIRGIDVPIGLGVGLGVQFVVLPLIYWPLLSILGRTQDDLAEPARNLADKASGAAGWVLLGLVVVVGAPVVEELFYRGLLLGALRKRRWPAVIAAAVSGAVFAAMHFQPLQFPGLFVLGTILALLVLRTGRLGSAIVAHATFNAVTVVALLSV
ncbi:MAG: lysostaphin resistance A-like protein [Actinomycetota bacterium]